MVRGKRGKRGKRGWPLDFYAGCKQRLPRTGPEGKQKIEIISSSFVFFFLIIVSNNNIFLFHKFLQD